jgi:hypothetical protein
LKASKAKAKKRGPLTIYSLCRYIQKHCHV